MPHMARKLLKQIFRNLALVQSRNFCTFLLCISGEELIHGNDEETLLWSKSYLIEL
jgi:hypothetical protein